MNILEQRAIRSKRVSYELVPLYRGDGYSEAVYARIGRACVETGAIIETCFAGALYVRVAPSLVGRFAELVKCGADYPPRYQSPTVFDNGTLVSCFATPEDELAGVWTERALRGRAREEQRAREEAEGT